MLVTGHDWQAVSRTGLPDGGFLVHNDRYAEGLGSSIARGVRSVRHATDAVLVLLASLRSVPARALVSAAASMGAVLLAAGTPGKRSALKHSRVMIHQPLGGFQGQASDIEIHAKEILIIRKRLNELMAEHTGQPLETIERDTERDFFMNAEQSRDYGLVDEVVGSRTDAPETAE